MLEPEAAVAMLHAGGVADSVLLIRRAVRESDPWSGHWSFPGGRCDPQDHDPLHTALRELEEECGIRLHPGHLGTTLKPTLAGRSGGHPVLVAPFLFRVDSELPTVLHLAEAAEARWVPLSLLRDPGRHRLRSVPGQPPEVYFPCIDLGGAPLWGFTYRLLTKWLGLGAEDSPQTPAGFGAACDIVEFLLGHGLTLCEGWHDRKVILQGAIPAKAVLDRFCRPGPHIQAVNRLEVRPGSIHLLGLGFEEYRIQAG